MDINNQMVGNRIKQLRLNFGMTLEEFGEKFNTSKSTVYNWEKGRNLPNKENLKLIADIGNISVDELLYGSELSNRREFITANIKLILEQSISLLKDNGFDVAELESDQDATFKEAERFLFEKTPLPALLKLSITEVDSKIKEAVETATSAYYSSFTLELVKLRRSLTNLLDLINHDNEIAVYGDSVDFDNLQQSAYSLLKAIEKIN